jgi:hypothetical protein
MIVEIEMKFLLAVLEEKLEDWVEKYYLRE